MGDLGPRGILARIKSVAPDGTLVLEFASGHVGTATGDFGFTPASGDVVIVQPDTNTLHAAPDYPWPDEIWVGVVRLREERVTVVDTNGRWRRVPTANLVEYGLGNTVEGTDEKGVTRVLSTDAIRLFDLPAIDDEFIKSNFLANTADSKETFEDFGGFPQVVERARKLLELPLRKRAQLDAIGARPVKGVLFTGDPGTGKTMLARIIAGATKAQFYEVSGPAIVSKWYGQSAEILRKVFDHARQQELAIIFFDEIDSIAASRGPDMHEESRRIVSQLLTLLDGFTKVSNVVIVAATNRPQDIDPALMRPGRFDWEIRFPIPNLHDRDEILRRSAHGVQTAADLPHEFVASKTPGWVPAELAAIWTEAALLAADDDRESITPEDYIGGFQLVAAQRRGNRSSAEER